MHSAHWSSLLQPDPSLNRPAPAEFGLSLPPAVARKSHSDDFYIRPRSEPQFHRPRRWKSHPAVSEESVPLAQQRELENMNLDAEQAHVRTNLDEYGRGADSDCARAMAEAENVLRELSLDALFRPQPSPGGSTADETPKAPSLDSRTS